MKLSNKIEVCLGCGIKLEQGIPFETFNYNPSIFLCANCQKHFKKIFANIRNDAFKIMGRNIRLNEKFDLFVENEEMLKVDIDDSIYFNSSKKVREYMFSLLEEVHRFAYHASFECHLFCDMFEEPNPLFFSDRFFLTNSAIKTMGAWEKILRFFSLFYEIELDTNPKNNSFITLQKKLKKTDFVNTQIYSAFLQLKSNGTFNKIDEARKNNDHNVSYHLGGNNYKVLSKIAIAVLQNTDAIYNGLEEALLLFEKRSRLVDKKFIQTFSIVTKVEENDKVFKKKALKIKSNFSFNEVNKIILKSVGYTQWANNRLEDVSGWKIKYSSPPLLSIYYRLIDITFRLHEGTRSLGFATDMFGDAIELEYVDLDKYWIRFDGMNYRYFIHSALIRIYSVYDKLGKIIQELFEVDLKNTSFEATIDYIRKNEDASFYNTLPPLKVINRIISHASYKKLYNTRQDFFHLLVMQDFMNPRYKEVIDMELMIAVIDNCKMIYELIETIDRALFHFHQIGLYHERNTD
ncbi:Cthe_2314 family HEPN domain-containing protein [Bacillaceae bacterium CLA-AA-H227]|uniref:Cthe_2314 family HEPN domain-containing protein n=1 Tax=Robertmurraya yapensis (ex Hitch et al 2024) TaxID=3133160 RepID=A0ACC6SHT8_9BACI